MTDRNRDVNPTPSESISADFFMEFEEDASVLAGAEPEFVYTPDAPVPLSIAAAPGLEQLKALLAALTTKERTELAQFLLHSLETTAADRPSDSPAATAP